MVNKLKKQNGFTILESIIAIFVLSLSISGAFSAVQQSLSQSIISKDEIKAFYLAQEAIEMIRNKRDANQLYKIANPSTSNTWLYGISQNSITDPCYFGKICKTDVVSNSLSYCGASWGSCSVLNQDTSSFLYSYGAYPATRYKREIQIESVNADEIAVIVRISWTKGIISKEFKVKTHLFNWI